MKLKGERAINNTLNYWLWKHGFKARIQGIDTDFFWYHNSNTIGYSLVAPHESNEPWEQLLAELDLKYKIDNFWTFFLHELGHSETWDLLTDEEIDESDETKELLRTEDVSSFDDNIYSIYYHLPSEIIATEWAVNFINTNPKAIVELTQKVAPKIKRFYELNNIIDN